VPHLKNTQQDLSHKKVCKFERVTQLHKKGDATTEEECFGYLLEDYLDLVVHYSILVRVF
jgi:hypothetical protein